MRGLEEEAWKGIGWSGRNRERERRRGRGLTGVARVLSPRDEFIWDGEKNSTAKIYGKVRSDGQQVKIAVSSPMEGIYYTFRWLLQR
jgi:hypothetical protein